MMNPKKRLKTRRAGVQPEPLRVVGSERTAFGTRLCQRVECTRCKKVDHVSVRVSNNKASYCRTCAEHILKTFESGRRIPEKKVKQSCAQCMRLFEVNERLTDKKDDLLCIDCYRGFDVWRGKAIPDKNSADFVYVFGAAQAKTIIRKVHK